MNIIFNRGKERYYRLFTIFEMGLKSYSKIFEKEDYILTYVVSKTSLSKDYEVSVTLSISKNPLWGRYFDEPRNLKSLLQSYCNYFSIKDITIVRPFKRFERNTASSLNTLPLEDRIFFEFYKHQNSLDFLD